MSSQRRCALLCLSLFAIPLACTDGESSGVELSPPRLTIESIRNASGSFFDEGEPIVATCDGRLTVLTGPSDVVAFLDNWTLRPPGSCGTLPQCGAIRLTVLEDETILAEVSRASVAVVLDLAPQILERASEFRVELLDGTTGEPFLVEGMPVDDQWAVQVSTTRDCPSPEGPKGDGGESGGAADGGAAAFGGLGGLGAN